MQALHASSQTAQARQQSGICLRSKAARSVVCRSAADTDLSARQPRSSSTRKAGRAVLAASKAGAQDVVQGKRPLAEYMALPASQYSVLDARKIERISDDMFKCYVGELKMFTWTAEPVLTVSVTVEPELQGCTIRLLSCTLRGSKIVEDINDKFSAQMTNVVRWRDVPAAATPGSAAGAPSSTADKQIVSTTSLNVELEIPEWCSFLPAKSIESVGSGVLQNVLNVMVPRFLAQLQRDYQLWAQGDTKRVADGQL